MALIIGGTSYFGNMLDQKRESEFPLYALVFSLAGVFLALYIVIKEVIKMGKKNDK